MRPVRRHSFYLGTYVDTDAVVITIRSYVLGSGTAGYEQVGGPKWMYRGNTCSSRHTARCRNGLHRLRRDHFHRHWYQHRLSMNPGNRKDRYESHS